MPEFVTSEWFVTFVLGLVVGRGIGYWYHCRDTRRWHAMLRRLRVPFDERFPSPLR